MRFSSRQISGKGKGRLLGFPTINLEIPGDFGLKDGIYAALVEVFGKKYKGALHFGPVPVFGEKEKSLEVFLIDAGLDFKMEGSWKVEIEIRDFIREVRNFGSEDELVKQIEKDVKNVRDVLGG